MLDDSSCSETTAIEMLLFVAVFAEAQERLSDHIVNYGYIE